MELRFYYCKHCGKVIVVVENTGTPTICCGDDMILLKPEKTDGAMEKHVPVVKIEGNRVTVSVGSVLHPMNPEHFIKWVLLQTDMGIQKKCLQPGEAPIAIFSILPEEKILNVYEYCSVHKLWKTE